MTNEVIKVVLCHCGKPATRMERDFYEVEEPVPGPTVHYRAGDTRVGCDDHPPEPSNMRATTAPRKQVFRSTSKKENR